jgi:hypothetical protein
MSVGAVLYSTKGVKCSAILQATTQNTTTTHNNQHEQLPPDSPATLPLSLHGQGKVSPKSSCRCSPTSVHRSRAVGLALAGVDSFVWGAKTAPIKREREGWGPGLRWPPLDGSTQQPIEGWRHRRVRGGCNGTLGYNEGVGGFPIVWGAELSNQKKKIERATGHWA